MIDSFSLDRTGFARFSDDRRMRYRLARALKSDAFDQGIGMLGDLGPGRNRVTFLMLNPSTADAFKPDRTVDKCCQFARRWGADILEVVNLFAFISTDPSELLKHHRLLRGDDITNDREILAACSGAIRVVAAWGNWGNLDGRAKYVAGLLKERHVELVHLGLTKHGVPKHPLARGKAFIPLTQEPEAFA